MTIQTSNIYALLIGINCYRPNRLPDGSYFRNLDGCVRDINRVEAFLKDVRKVPEDQIIKLTATASASDESQPIEPPEQLPTRDNMVAGFRKLGEVAPVGSQIYIHYAGHGGRAKTVFAEIKGEGELDEGLAPTDLGTSVGQYLRDLELAHLLQELVKQDLLVTVVLDCCHSGGATRGDTAVRGTDVEDDKPLQPGYQPVASMQELRATWESLNRSGTRGLKTVGIPDSDEYVVLAACRQNEVAYEYAFNRETREKSGALTYWLLDTLRQASPGQTYKMLYDRINARIHGQFPSQTPLLIGAGSRLVFGSEEGEIVFSVPVIKVEPKDNGLEAVLGVGQANGITKGAEFAIYPADATDLNKKEDRVAIAKVIQRGSSTSICKLEAIEGQELAVEPGDQAVQIAVAPSLVRLVSLLPQLEDADEPTKQALTGLKDTLAEQGKGWLELGETVAEGDNGEGIDFFVEVNHKGEYEIRDTAGELLKNINPALKIDDPKAPEKVVKRLIHLAKYRAALTIDNFDSDSPLTGKLSVEWLGTSDIYDLGDPIPKPAQLHQFADPTKPSAKDGEHVFLSIRNDSATALNVAVLSFDANWSVTQIHPGSTENFITLEAGKEEKLPINTSLEGTGEAVENTLKVFATRDQANFRWLELPSLDEQITSKGLTRSGNPLDALLAAIDEEQPKTRRLRVAASPSRDWTTQQLTLTITK
ncbi:MAG: caspase family protein [Microcoleaceae cyanobacterium]